MNDYKELAECYKQIIEEKDAVNEALIQTAKDVLNRNRNTVETNKRMAGIIMISVITMVLMAAIIAFK